MLIAVLSLGVAHLLFSLALGGLFLAFPPRRSAPAPAPRAVVAPPWPQEAARCLNPELQSRLGQLIGRRYLVVDHLGAGTHSRVYAARSLGERGPALVAIKALSDDTLWRHEARLLSQLSDHPAFPRLLGAFQAGDSFYLVMECIRGRSLRWLLQGRTLSLTEALSLGGQLAGALAHLQRRGIVHQDIKPENILAQPSGHWRLIDLGIAVQGDPARFGGCGTFDYMAPEQVRGAPCFSSDVYALGVTMWEALSGGRPAPLRQCFPPLPVGCPPELEALLRAMLAQWPERRPTAFEVAQQLARLSHLLQGRWQREAVA